MAGQRFRRAEEAGGDARASSRCRSASTASMTIHNKLRTVDSQNVSPSSKARDPKLKDEYVVYTAHWDHLRQGAR